MARIKPVVVKPQGRMICAWCPPGSPTRDLGPYAGPGDSHGICEACAHKLLAEAERQREPAYAGQD